MDALETRLKYAIKDSMGYYVFLDEMMRLAQLGCYYVCAIPYANNDNNYLIKSRFGNSVLNDLFFEIDDQKADGKRFLQYMESARSDPGWAERCAAQVKQQIKEILYCWISRNVTHAINEGASKAHDKLYVSSLPPKHQAFDVERIDEAGLAATTARFMRDYEKVNEKRLDLTLSLDYLGIQFSRHCYYLYIYLSAHNASAEKALIEFIPSDGHS